MTVYAIRYRADAPVDHDDGMIYRGHGKFATDLRGAKHYKTLATALRVADYCEEVVEFEMVEKAVHKPD